MKSRNFLEKWCGTCQNLISSALSKLTRQKGCGMYDRP
uniref:Signalosome complex subunit 7a protein n=1 Tax=Siphoviridae sp. ct87j35 TaxID=2825356 RepID=A0A8S5V4K0_9CAUD|nr:MAG TPA: signalosome complex subunit 7a protein [Siphoviridae sp. ct87j35]